MNFKTFVPTLLLALSSTAANAAVAPFRLPTVNGYAVTLPGLSILPMTMPGVTFHAETSAPSLKSMALPVAAPVALPSPVPALIVPARLPAPAIAEHFVIDWSFLNKDGGDAAPALVPDGPAPKPLSPAGALDALVDAALSREVDHVEPGNLFDGQRKSSRELELPHNRYF